MPLTVQWHWNTFSVNIVDYESSYCRLLGLYEAANRASRRTMRLSRLAWKRSCRRCPKSRRAGRCLPRPPLHRRRPRTCRVCRRRRRVLAPSSSRPTPSLPSSRSSSPPHTASTPACESGVPPGRPPIYRQSRSREDWKVARQRSNSDSTSVRTTVYQLLHLVKPLSV